MKLNKSQKVFIISVVLIFIVFFGILYFIAINNNYDVEWRKSTVKTALFFFLYLNVFILPSLIYFFMTSKRFKVKDKYGYSVKASMLFIFSLSAILYYNIEKPIEDFIDPNAKIKRETNLKLQVIKTQLRSDSIRFSEKIKSYKKIQKEISSYNENNELCGYESIKSHLKKINVDLAKQLDSIELTQNLIKTHNAKRSDYLKYIDSLYSQSEKINKTITKVIAKETWYNKTKYLEYLIAFMLGVLSNICFFFISRKIIKVNK